MEGKKKGLTEREKEKRSAYFHVLIIFAFVEFWPVWLRGGRGKEKGPKSIPLVFSRVSEEGTKKIFIERVGIELVLLFSSPAREGEKKKGESSSRK